MPGLPPVACPSNGRAGQRLSLIPEPATGLHPMTLPAPSSAPLPSAPSATAATAEPRDDATTHRARRPGPSLLALGARERLALAGLALLALWSSVAWAVQATG